MGVLISSVRSCVYYRYERAHVRIQCTVESGVTRRYNVEGVQMHESVMHSSAMKLHNIRTLKSFMHASGSLMTLNNTRVPMRSDTHQNSVYGSMLKYCKYVEPIQYENANEFWINT